MGISVLISVYGGANAEHLGVALESIAAQTLPADEVVLMEDGPLGAAHRDVIDAYADERTLVVLLEPGGRVSGMRGRCGFCAAPGHRGVLRERAAGPRAGGRRHSVLLSAHRPHGRR